MARLKPFLCVKDMPLLVGFGTSSEVGELAGHSHCFSEDSEAVARRRSLEENHQDFGRSVIRNENEYKDAVRRLGEQEERLKQTKLSKDAIKRVLDPVRSFHEQIKDEVASYERLKRGEFDELQNFSGIGRLLIALRIAKGLTQRELAERLEVSESRSRATNGTSTTASPEPKPF